MTKDQASAKRWKVEPYLGGIALILLLLGCFFVLRPFLSSLMWAIVLAYSLYPLQRRFTTWFRGSRTLAACFVTLTMTILLAGPILLIGMSMAQDAKDLAKATREWFLSAPEEAPAWVERVPMVGEELSGYWREFAEDRNRWIEQLEKEVETTDPHQQGVAPRPKIVIESGGESILTDAPPLVSEPPTENPGTAPPTDDEKKEAPQISHAVVLLGRLLAWAQSWLLTVGLVVGRSITQVLISAFLAFFLLRDASLLADRLNVAVDRLTGGRGSHLLKVAGDTVRGVVFGILGTAIVQAIVAGIGFSIAGVPGAVLLSLLTFFFAVIPFGPPLVWIPASLWLFAQGQTGMGIFMFLWGLLGISSVDNIVRPFLISQGSKMPFVLIFCGVIGGALSFGLVGVFLGPTLLAVAFRLIEEWSATPSTDEIGEGETSALRGESVSPT
ncbi:MAG: AI-2E family transporter [Luteolibacter sp.]